MFTVANRSELLTVKEAAVRLRLHPLTVRRMIADGRLPAVQLGGRGTSIRVDSDELAAFLFGLPEEHQ